MADVHRPGIGLVLLLAAGLVPPALPAAETPYVTAAQDTATDSKVAAGAAPARVSRWMRPGAPGSFAAHDSFANEFGEVGVLLDGAALGNRQSHPFFQPLGSNGRGCVTCHQPQDGMSLSLDTIRWVWNATGGKDPLFAAVDGKNCPHLPQGDPAAHSLLLKRGLIRVFLPWPPKGPDGQPIDPEFTIEVVRDPTGCNTHPQYGLHSPNPTISVYRRPRPVANTKYTTHEKFGVLPFIGKNGLAASRDPDTGRASGMNLMADARAPSLRAQAEDAAAGHLQVLAPLRKDQVAAILDFESRVYVAQEVDRRAGSLVEPDGPSGLGPQAMLRGEAGVLGNNVTRWVIPMEEKWQSLPRSGDAAQDGRNAARESIQRGHDVYMFRTFWIRDSMHLNSVGLGNPTKRTCATCHGMHMTGMDTANGWMDIGTTNLPWATETPLNPWSTEQPEMPLFKVTCKDRVPPHPFLGRVIYTQDPGRALISGRCNDVGTIVMQQLRGMAARPPYFSNGSAQTLREVVDFYDRRYNIGYTEQEKQDLVNFMGVL
ncbi:MAG: hypothetical protein IT480_11880 [Gammaproteobacteria bacterium]|nr:hypothetical protein [Gammaproteobacteria bacterium]